jgi:pimeloyl-ACP methyl ester carboxylesterase
VGKDTIPENEMKLVVDPALALYGDDDVFVSIKRLRSWAGKLMGAGKGGRGQFRHREVANAGHFWHDHDALKILQEEVKEFVRSL